MSCLLIQIPAQVQGPQGWRCSTRGLWGPVPLRMQPYALGLGCLSQVIKTELIQRVVRFLSQEGLRMPLRRLATHFTLDLSKNTDALNPCLARTK